MKLKYELELESIVTFLGGHISLFHTGFIELFLNVCVSDQTPRKPALLNF